MSRPSRSRPSADQSALAGALRVRLGDGGVPGGCDPAGRGLPLCPQAASPAAPAAAAAMPRNARLPSTRLPAVVLISVAPPNANGPSPIKIPRHAARWPGARDPAAPTCCPLLHWPVT
jgi:hypothetical protein